MLSRRRTALAALAALAGSLCLWPATASAAPVLKSAKIPVWVHHTGDADAAFAESVLAAVEDAWRFQVEGLGFPPPPPDAGKNGSDDYDIFVEPTPNHGVCERDLAVPGKPGSYRSHLTVDPSLPESALPLVTSHELHHAIQMGICGDSGNNIAEAGAVYISGIHRKGEAKALTYSLGFNTFQQSPERSLDWQGDLGDPYPYGGALFLMFLDQRYGTGDGHVVKKIWDTLDKLRSPAGCLHYFEGIRAVVDFDAAFREFTRTRFFVGKADDARHLRDLASWEGGALPQKKLLSVTLAADHAELPVSDAKPATRPMPYGASYVRLSLAGLGPADRVRLAFEGDPKVRWSLETILIGDAVQAEESSTDVDATGARTMDIVVGAHASLVVAFTNLGDGHYVGDGPGWKGSSLSYSFTKVEDPPAASPAPPATIEKSGDGGCAVGTPGARSRGDAGLAALAAVVIGLRRRIRRRHDVRALSAPRHRPKWQ